MAYDKTLLTPLKDDQSHSKAEQPEKEQGKRDPNQMGNSWPTQRSNQKRGIAKKEIPGQPDGAVMVGHVLEMIIVLGCGKHTRSNPANESRDVIKKRVLGQSQRNRMPGCQSAPQGG